MNMICVKEILYLVSCLVKEKDAQKQWPSMKESSRQHFLLLIKEVNIYKTDGMF